ncbi:MAG: hypothetical protein JNL49_02895 [Bacteroidia bacterium]|nr:hypothetical protein [Bacteroidia bacterium]
MMTELIQTNWQNKNIRLGDKPCLSLTDFFVTEFADALYNELKDSLTYQKVNLNGVTKLNRGERELGDTYFGKFLVKQEKEINAINTLLRLSESQEFLHFLSNIMQEEIIFLRPGTPYLMNEGDKICIHDDMSDPIHSCAVVFNFTKNWQKGYGGNTIVGTVLREVDIVTPPEVPFQLTKLFLKKEKKIITPRYNTCLILKLKKGFGHGVSQIKSNKNRLSFVTIYGSYNRDK